MSSSPRGLARHNGPHPIRTLPALRFREDYTARASTINPFLRTYWSGTVVGGPGSQMSDLAGGNRFSHNFACPDEKQKLLIVNPQPIREAASRNQIQSRREPSAHKGTPSVLAAASVV